MIYISRYFSIAYMELCRTERQKNASAGCPARRGAKSRSGMHP
jgi:hypothetical protein